MRTNPLWQDVEQYRAFEEVDVGEAGKLNGVIFLEVSDVASEQKVFKTNDNINTTLIFGEEAYASTMLKGKDIEIVFAIENKNIYAEYKIEFETAITNQDWIIRILHHT